MSICHTLRKIYLSLFARIVVVYLISLIALSATTALVAVDQFDQLGREWQQRTQIDMAHRLTRVLQGALDGGVDSPQAKEAVARVMTINPALSLYVLDSEGVVVGAYSDDQCGLGQTIDRGAINELLSTMPMLPVYASMPCRGDEGVFSVAAITYGQEKLPGYLFVRLEANTDVSMANIWQTSSIFRTLLIVGCVALSLTLAVGLALFALLTRRFSRLTRTVQRFSEGDYRQRSSESTDDEIGRLGIAFNNMAATIEAQLEALQETDRQRRELVANLSHEFRTPLTALQGYAKQLSRTSLNDDAREGLDAIHSNVGRLTRLAEQLSQMSRSNLADRPLCLETFSFAELANDILGKFRPRAVENGIDLGVENHVGMAAVLADVELIDHALTNLVDNAISATNRGGTVTIRMLEFDASTLKVGVRDTGIGIPAEEIPLVSQRFYRTAGGRDRGAGTGLGLAIVFEVLKRHDSRLILESRQGKGTCAWFTLPLSPS
ncbi:HAMP domain-containing sensor histidine kinase [Chromohalobacter sp. HP20-39]|uniref:sensor histidine kinase n=1 Tax=Chromohalobacter sp. HP20-39 TaxID=3079306 RepID=UPI00294B27AD|nr:HAMP domain-containing sensor histidine kinase [Chromohalobacter sp. HP20-39]MDV6318267.1 HAMP domain-containing sensor histidine kinase [Chromohalobacter sp. HP20-39]